MAEIRFRTLTSLAKVFPTEYPPYMECRSVSGFENEPVAFQIALCSEYPVCKINIRFHAESDLDLHLYQVECTPSDNPIYPNHDRYLLSDKPGMYPDVLLPITSETDVAIIPGVWTSIYIEMTGCKTAGEHNVTVTATEGENTVGVVTMPVTILPAELPKQKLLHTSWFHTDCLATWYNVEPMSEEYWRITENFAREARAHGLTMLLTPVFTPALDTAIGSERPTVQLVDVKYDSGKYTFGFEKVRRWFEMCHRVGIEYFEISHLFTQWGAAHAPKIMATVDGVYKRIFGWETDSLGTDYYEFLKAFSAAFVPFLAAEGVQNNCYLHVSDEPSDEVLERYSRCAQIITELFPGFKVIDALSHTSYYEKGIITRPIPGTSAVEDFVPFNVPEKWCYYCCGHHYNLSNRFFCMSLARTRILGMQLYKYNMDGFLQWGFNFWYSQLSRRPIDPFRISDAGRAFPSGDAYVVYPGDNGEPLISIRLKAFYEGFNDMRALQLLESLIGREKTVQLLENNLAEPLTFTNFPHTEEWLVAKRDEINKAILAALKK